MAEPIVELEAIAQSAERAARQWALNPREEAPRCPYAIGTEARACWNAALCRYLVLFSALTADEESSA